MDHRAILKDLLHRLRLGGALDALDERCRQLTGNPIHPVEFAVQILSHELDARNNRTLARRLARSHLDPVKTLESFDFRFNPAIHEPTIRDLATAAFVTQADNLLILGPSGVGKSHLVQALGHQACRAGHDVLFKRTDVLLKDLYRAQADGSRSRKLKHLLDIDLLILDDFGLVPLSTELQSDLYEIIAGRYEKRATIFTSNRDFSEWMAVFTNPLLASAAIDRIVHRAIHITIPGKSYRADAFARRQKALPCTAKRQ